MTKCKNDIVNSPPDPQIHDILLTNERFLNIEYATYQEESSRWSIQSVAPKNNIISNKISDFGAIAPQLISENDILMSQTLTHDQSENCLNLNIYKTKSSDSSVVADKKLCPVMVWIHGGGFNVGAGSLPIYEGSHLAEVTKTIVITFNYRLGALGFLRLVDVTNGEITSTGNEGIEDQITALKWIQENIHLYGGDKKNITLFGESAGAMSIACLLAMPKAKGLFHKAIMQSGAGHTYSTIEQSNNVAKEFLNSAKSLGFLPSQLSSLTTAQIINIQQHFLARPEIYKQFGILPFKPVIGTESLPLPPHQAIKQGCAVDIPIISGTNTDEWTLFAAMLNQKIPNDKSLHNAITPLIGKKNIASCVELMSAQCLQRNISTSPQNLLSETYTEFWFNQPSQRLLESQVAAGGIAFSYKLGRKSEIPTLRCTHITDIGLLFNHLSEKFYGNEPRLIELVNELQTCWGAFAHCGNPSTSSNTWHKVENNNQTFLFFDHNNTYSQAIDPKSPLFWAEVNNKQLASF